MLVYFGVRAIFRGFKCMSYPEVYILGRQVDGVYVEYSEPYLSKIEAELDKHHYEIGQSMSHDAGSWKILKYGRPITLEVQHG
ncbi:hypothetical protein HMPREF9509_02672 [Enterococcus faecalis TX0411]|jgi:hypothetical protein|nr:hypothetical protein HMPREF9509_02672 [Enterococcus faecalis TX0411]